MGWWGVLTAWSLPVPLASVSLSSVYLYAELINVHMPSCVRVHIWFSLCPRGSPRSGHRDRYSVHSKPLILQTSVTSFSGQSLQFLFLSYHGTGQEGLQEGRGKNSYPALCLYWVLARSSAPIILVGQSQQSCKPGDISLMIQMRMRQLREVK